MTIEQPESEAKNVTANRVPSGALLGSVVCRKCLNPASMGAPSRWRNGKHYIMCSCCYHATGDWDSAAEAVEEWVKLNLPNNKIRDAGERPAPMRKLCLANASGEPCP